jgi:hypothetical protein
MTITLPREEAQQVLDALADAAGCVQTNYQPGHLGHGWGKEIETLRARLAQPEHEWQGLTDEEIMGACAAVWASHPIDVGRIIEAKLKEKNT